MGWGRIDGSLHSHPKIIELAAMRGGARSGLLWVRALSYCAEHGTDGHVSRAVCRALGGSSSDARRLVEVSLWERAGVEGWRFHDWGDHNPTGQEITDHKARKARNQRESRSRRPSKSGRESRGRGVNVTGDDRGPVTGDLARVRDTDPTRPDPLTPSPTETPPLRGGEFALRLEEAPELQEAAKVQEVFDTWRHLHGTAKTTLTAKRRARIRARLNEGTTVEMMKAALRGALADEWTMGTAERSTKSFRGIDTILRDADKVEDLARLDGKPTARPKGPAPPGDFSCVTESSADQLARMMKADEERLAKERKSR